MWLWKRRVFLLLLAIVKMKIISAQIGNTQNVMHVFSIDLNPKSQRHSSPLALFNTMSSRPNVILQIEGRGPISVERSPSHSDNQQITTNTRTFTLPGPLDMNREISIQTNPFGEIVLDILPDATVNLRKSSQSFVTTEESVLPDHKRSKQNAENTQKTEGHNLDSRNTNSFLLNSRGTIDSQTLRNADPPSTKSTNSNNNIKEKSETRKQSERLVKQSKNNRKHELNSSPSKHNADRSKPPTEHDFLRHQVRMIQENGQADTPNNEVTNARFNPMDLFSGQIPTAAFLNPFTHGMLPLSDGDNEPGPLLLHPNNFFFNQEIPPQSDQNAPTFPDHAVQGERRNNQNPADIMDMFFQHRLMDGMEEMSTFSKPILTRPTDTVIVNDSIGVSDSSLNNKNSRRKHDQSNPIIENTTILPAIPAEQRKSNPEVQVKSSIPGPLIDMQHNMQKGVKVMPLHKEPGTVTIDRGNQVNTEHAINEKPTKSHNFADTLNNMNIPTTTSLMSILSGEMVNPQFTIATPPPQFTDELVNPHFVDGLLFNSHFTGGNVQLPNKTPKQQLISRNHSNDNRVANDKPSFAGEIGGTSSTNGVTMGFSLPQKAVGRVPNIHTSIAQSKTMSSPTKKDRTTIKSSQHSNSPRDTMADKPDLISSNKQLNIFDNENTASKNMEQNHGQSLNIPRSLTPEVYMSAKPEFGLYQVNNVSVNKVDNANGIILDLQSNTSTLGDRGLFNILGVGAANTVPIGDIKEQHFETAVKSNSPNTITANDKQTFSVEISGTLPTTGAPNVQPNLSNTSVIANSEPVVVTHNQFELSINNETIKSTLINEQYTNAEKKPGEIVPQTVDFSTINTTTQETVQPETTVDKQTDKKKDKKKKSSKKKRKSNKKNSNKSKSKTPEVEQNGEHTKKSEQSKSETENKTQEQLPNIV